jgi:glycosyltransferase involved in cell wall biosynthesis
MRFDIVLPTIARGSLFHAINSVCQQTYTDWTLWVVQDGTYTSDMLTQAFPNSNVRFVHKEHTEDDSGASARNYGISLGNADWIAYIDDDDEWLPHHLATLVNMAQANPDATMLRTAGQSFSMKHKSPRSSKKVQKLGPINTTDILTVGMAHRRELFLQTPGWQPQDNHDHLLWQHMLQVGGQPYEIDAVTFYFER